MYDIKDHLIASYRCKGKTNDDIDRDVLKDLSGNGHDIVLKNFGFAFGSGYGLYRLNWLDKNMWYNYVSNEIRANGEVASGRIHITKIKNPASVLETKLGFKSTEYKVRVKGVTENIFLKYVITSPSGNKITEIKSDGIYTLPSDEYASGYNMGWRIVAPSYPSECDITIEQIPEYEGALVFDGINNYGICENFPALKDFTFVYKRINLNPSKVSQAFISNKSTEITKRLIIEHTYTGANVIIAGNVSKSIASVYDPFKNAVYVSPTSYNGQISLGNPTFDPVVGLILGTYPSESSVYCWNGAFYSLDIYDRTLSDEYLQKALNRINDIDINWKDGVGEVTDQHLTISPGSGTGNAAVSFGSVMDKGLDRTLELEITTPKGVKKTLTVNQEGCRQAYITSDGKRWLTSDNRVYGVLKSDVPCKCTGDCP